MDHDGRHYPNKLIKYRKIFEYSQIDVAKKLGMERSRYIELEQGKRFPSGITLLKLSIVFHVLPMDLYEDVYRKLKETLREYNPFSCLTRISEDE